MSKYITIRNNKPTLTICKDPREVIFAVISCMCDNKYTFKLKKNSEGDFKLSAGMFSLRNFSFNHQVHDIEWAADAGEWNKVIDMLNSGTSVLESVKSR